MIVTRDAPRPSRSEPYRNPDRARIAKMLNKVPEVTLYFWIIKILATTVGETAADYLNTTLNLGLSYTTAVMAGFLAVALFFQFRLKRYIPAVFSLANQAANVAASATAKTIVVVTSETPKLSVRLSVISVPTTLIRTTASQ